MKRQLLGMIFFVYCVHAMQRDEPLHVMVDANALFDQGVFSRASVIAARLNCQALPEISQPAKHRGFWSAVLAGAKKAADCAQVAKRCFEAGIPWNEEDGQAAFFGVIRPAFSDHSLPTIWYKKQELPPIIVAWLLGRLKTTVALDKLYRAFDAQKFSDDSTTDARIRALQKAIAFAAFDTDAIAQTCQVSAVMQKRLLQCEKAGLPVYFVGHVDPASYERLQKQAQSLLDCFKGRFVSHEVRPDEVNEHTTFDCAWWRAHIMLPDGKRIPGGERCILVGDDSVPDSGAYYARSSPAFEQLIKPK